MLHSCMSPVHQELKVWAVDVIEARMVAAVPELVRELLALLARVKRGGDYPVILTKV